jgi:cardiolipin synthase
MSLPNLITIGRILLVPLTIWLIVTSQFEVAFVTFVAAGVSDAVDGLIAKRYGMITELGTYLDPIADKALLVSIYVSLGLQDHLPAWLVILVASRDVLIVGGVVLAWVVDRPMLLQPRIVSKVNTAGQILLAGGVLLLLGMEMPGSRVIDLGIWAVALLTVASGAVYLVDWARHVANGNGGKGSAAGGWKGR